MTSTLIDPAAVREGHRALLETFAEFAAALHAGDGVLPHPAVLTGTVAFLRESLLPFARREEMALDGCPETRDDAAFEHAFLAMETDRLAAAVQALLVSGARGADSRAARLDEVRRRMHRIEAVLELHVLRAENREQESSEREDGGPCGGEGPVSEQHACGSAARADTGAVCSLQPAEASAFLRRREWGVLSTIGADGPHSVPVSYGWDGRRIFFASGPGTKVRHMERNPAVSLVVLQVVDGSRWTSVLVRGEAIPVRDVAGRIRALATLARQRLGGTPLTAADLARMRGAMIFRIEPSSLTGRARGEPQREDSDRSSDFAGSAGATPVRP